MAPFVLKTTELAEDLQCTSMEKRLQTNVDLTPFTQAAPAWK